MPHRLRQIRSSTSAVLAFLALSCSLFPPVVMESPEGVVVAKNGSLARRAIVTLAEYDAQVRAILGTSRHPPMVEVGWTRARERGMGGCNTEYHIVIQTTWSGAPSSAMERFLVHELLHWHATGVWRALPFYVEEGMVFILERILMRENLVIVDPPEPALLEKALSTGRETGPDRDRLIAAGIWFVSSTSLEELRSLAQRAQDEGFEEIPVEWLVPIAPEHGTSVSLSWSTLSALKPQR